jgi:porphobilinogen synthase
MNRLHRPRRNRRTPSIRELVAETQLSPGQLIFPVFLCGGTAQRQPIATMPDQFRFSVDEFLKRVPYWSQLGLTSFALFPKIDDKLKDSTGSESLNPKGFLPTAVEQIKDRFPELTIITDIALDPYSTDGHDGIVKNGEIINDETVEQLTLMALNHAKAGADYVAPSDMMDGRVGEIRRALEKNGFSKTGIMAYSAKYASGFYGPFRDALDSAPKAGDKKTYQMDCRNSNEALREVQLDINQGADIVMVKPALSYLDVIHRVKKMSAVPVAAYNVSGEYSMVKAAAAAGMIDETKVMVEILYSIKRAGADMILSYHAPDMAKWLSENT